MSTDGRRSSRVETRYAHRQAGRGRQLSGFRRPKTRAEGRERETDLPRHGGRQPCEQPTESEGEQLREWPAFSPRVRNGCRDDVDEGERPTKSRLDLARHFDSLVGSVSLSLFSHRVQTRTCSHKFARVYHLHQKTPAPLPLRNSLASSRLTHSLTLRAHLTIAAGGNNGDVLTYNSKSFVIFFWTQRVHQFAEFFLFPRETGARLTQPRTASCDVRRYWTEAPPPPPSLPPTPPTPAAAPLAFVRGCKAACKR